MKQVVRRVIDRKGKVVTLDLPEPHMGPDQVLVQNHYSLISTGTEMSTLKKTPAELVKQTLSDPWMRHVVTQTIFATGLTQTARRVWQEMIMPRQIGYSGAGRILEVGDNARGFAVGQKVAYAATGHAEVAAPTVNHLVPVPESVDLRHAAFVTVGGIAMQSLRRAEIQLGEIVAVYGLGLIGQLCAMIAKAAGAVVVGIDISDSRNQLAEANGADLVIHPGESDLARRIMDFTGKNGVDATIICASSTSDEIVNSSMEITRRQGRVVIVGYVKLDVHPKNFLYREIDLRYSRAYGPGSYHRGYEKGRLDYPFGYVRWTEQRNLQELIRLISSGAIRIEPLIGNDYPADEAQKAFDALADGTLGGVAALLDYDGEKAPDRRRTLPVRPRPKSAGKVGISVVGCGNHFLSKHMPNLRSMSGVEIRGLASATGKNASMIAEKIGATVTTSDVGELLRDPDTDALLICSGHAEHYAHIRQAIKAGKPIFVEKPMVTLLEELKEIYRLMSRQPVLFTLGLNRRYSPLIGRLQELFEGPVLSVEYMVSQPFIPPEHWTLDEVDGGGRLLCEGEHFIDLVHLLIGGRPLSIEAQVLGREPETMQKLCNFSINLRYHEAQARIVFVECAAAGYPRERLTVAGNGQIAVLEDFAKLTFYRGKKKRTYGNPLKKEMGHREALREFVAAVRGEANRSAGWEEVAYATLTMFAAEESIRRGAPIDLAEFGRRFADPQAEADPQTSADPQASPGQDDADNSPAS